MKPITEMSIGELAAYICSQLSDHGIDTVLTGGGCVTIYSENRYQSKDLDFIENVSSGRRKLTAALAVIGFKPNNDRYYIHPDTSFYLEFPPGPLAIGDQPAGPPVTMEFETGTLRILSPTDCIKDRLAAFFYWNDRQGLEQAVMVAKANPHDLKEIERWADAEGESGKFSEFKTRLK